MSIELSELGVSDGQSSQIRSPTIIVQQVNLKRKTFYRKLILAVAVFLLLLLICRSLYLAFRCNYRPVHVFELLENRRNAVDRKNYRKATGWLCHDPNQQYLDLLAYPMSQKPMLLRNLTEETISKFMNESPVTAVAADSSRMTVSRIREVCQNYGWTDRILSPWHVPSSHSWSKNCDGNLRQCPLVVDDINRRAVCLVPKVFEPADIGVMWPNTTQSSIRFVSPIEFIEQTNYTKYLFAVHPFVRLVRAYRKRFELPERQPDGQPFVVNNETMHVWTFPDWCQEILLPTDPYQYDPSWAPIWTQCEPCFIRYDHIGQYSQYEYSETKFYLSKLSPKTLLELYKKFYLDFELFGYTIEEIFVV